MEFRITDKRKKEIFISIFHLLKNTSSQINLVIDKDTFHIQGIDKSHVCLYNLQLKCVWFDFYNVLKNHELCFDTTNFYSMICTKSDDQTLVFYLDDTEADKLIIELKSNETELAKKSDYNKYFKLPLIEYDYEQMIIPTTEYDAEFSLPSKKITDMLSQLSNFGDDLNIKCSQECVDFKTNGDSGEMRVNIPINDLSSYAIVEDEIINLNYSLTYISKMCVTNKLTNNVDFYMNNEVPMKINYNFGDEGNLAFYIAPKIID